MSNWVDSQQRPRSTLEIEADSLGHDLTYGWSHFLRGTRSQPERAAGVNAGEMARQDVGSANPDVETAGVYVGDNGYSGDGDGEGDGDRDLGEPRAGEAALASGGEADPAGLTGDVLAGESATEAAPTVSITESESFAGLESGETLAASGLTDSDSLPEPEAVPF
jgi:hypothetical protein